MQRFVTLFVLAFTLFAPVARAQGAWDYLELLRSSTTEGAGDRWRGVAASGCASVPDGTDCLALALPKALVGDRDVTVVLTAPAARGDAAFSTLSGPAGEAVCARTNEALSCFLELGGLEIDAAAVEAWLDRSVADASARDRAKRVAERFRAERVLRYWHGIR